MQAIAAPNASAADTVIYFYTHIYNDSGRTSSIMRWVEGRAFLEEVVQQQTNGSFGQIVHMQLVPGTRRIHWSESERLIPGDFRSTVFEFWSSDLNGGDIRSEFGLVDGVIDAAGEKIYYYDDAIAGFARINIDGTGNEEMGFGGGPNVARSLGLHPDGEWLYFLALEQVATPGSIHGFYSIFRGHVETGVTEELDGATGYEFDEIRSPPELQFEFDLENGFIHAFGQFGIADDMALVKFDLDTGERLGLLEFGEGEGGPNLFTFDANKEEYYYLRDPFGGQPLLRRIAYEDVTWPPDFLYAEAQAETTFSFPRQQDSNNRFIVPYTLQYETTQTVLVPEPSQLALTVASLGAVGFAIRQRRAAEQPTGCDQER